MTDEQIEAIATYATCPRRGCPCRPATASLTAHDSLRGWDGNVRDLVEAALKRAGVQLAEPWRSDEPPADSILLCRRSSQSFSVARVRRTTNGGWITYGTGYNLGTIGIDWVWRHIGPNPFEELDRAKEGS